MKVLTVYAHQNPRSFCHGLLEHFTQDCGTPKPTGSASWWFRAGRHHQCKDVLLDGRAGQAIGAGEQG